MLGLRLAHSYVAGWIPVGARETVFVLLMAGGMLIGHAWTFQLVDRRGWSFVGLGPKAWRRDFIGFGALLGALAIAVPCAALLGVRWLRIVPSDPGSSLGAGLATLAVLVPAALWEELFVRGYAFSVLRERWGPLPAIGLTSLVFALMHLLNDGASARVFVIVVLAGLFLGCIREATRSLYAAWAAHLSWNAVLVVFFHAPVSGLAMAAPDYRVTDTGPDWATGGTWGPEGGMFAAIGLVAALWYVFQRANRPGEPNA
ncbi:MAG TPA: CPBP family intramembrane glutamic endopeptidase [Gemmatimonadaceae bacterium]